MQRDRFSNKWLAALAMFQQTSCSTTDAPTDGPERGTGVLTDGLQRQRCSFSTLALRGKNWYLAFSSLAMARAIRSTFSTTSWSRKRMTFQPMASKCSCRFESASTNRHDRDHQSRQSASLVGRQNPRPMVQSNVAVGISNRTIVSRDTLHNRPSETVCVLCKDRARSCASRFGFFFRHERSCTTVWRMKTLSLPRESPLAPQIPHHVEKKYGMNQLHNACWKIDRAA